MPEMISMSNEAPTAPNCKKLACLQIASVLHAASSVVRRAHDATSKGKTRPLSSKDTTASSHPALEIIALCMQPGTAAESALFHRCSQKDSIRTPSIRKRTVALATEKITYTEQESSKSTSYSAAEHHAKPQRWPKHWCSSPAQPVPSVSAASKASTPRSYE